MNKSSLILFIFIWISFTIQYINADYYSVLELTKEATEDEIKRAFRRLSIKYHPDKNPDDDVAAKRFLDVNKAHEVLTNKELRQIYDLRGEEGLEQHTKQESDPWAQKQQRGPNAYGDIWVTLNDLYNGATKEMTINRNVLCPQCRGTGAKDGKTIKCKACGGQGSRMQNVQVAMGFTMQMQVTCDQCQGKGHVHASNCPNCYGKKVVPDKKIFEVEIERGMQDGKEIVFEKESEQSPNFIPGDVIFKVKTMNHKIFQRKGDDLHTTYQIDLRDALLGFKKQLKHLDDHYTQLESDEVIQPNQIKVIKEEGMPIHNVPSSFGDLYVKYQVRFPKKLNQQDKELLLKIFDGK